MKVERRQLTPPHCNEGGFTGSTAWLKTLLQPPGPHARWVGLTRLLFLVITVFWTALFLHNSQYLSADVGFDIGGHFAYINHFRTSWSVPLPGQAWGMHHPPLYYFVVATLLNFVGYAPDTAGGILTIRLFNLVLALANIYIILACLRLMFPEHPRRWVLGLIVAGFLPMFVYLYQYPLNHCLAGTLASATLYFVLRILCASSDSTWDYVLAGLALGSAILSIISAGVLVVPVGVALLANFTSSVPKSTGGGRCSVSWFWPPSFSSFVVGITCTCGRISARRSSETRVRRRFAVGLVAGSRVWHERRLLPLWPVAAVSLV